MLAENTANYFLLRNRFVHHLLLKQLTARKQIQENLQVRFPTAKVSVKRATERAGGGVAYIATVKNSKDLLKIRILSFDEDGNEIQNADI